MKNDRNRPILYIDKLTTPESREARQLLARAGFDVDVRIAPRYYRAAYGAPVLLGLFTRFQGLDGIRSLLAQRGLTKPDALR